MPTLLRLALPLALLAGCATAAPAPRSLLGPAAPAPTRAQAEALARAADQAFSAAAVAHDAQAFAAFLAADTVFVSGGGVAPGVAAVLNDWAPLLRPGGPTLAWAPDLALAAGSGDLVLTRGAYVLTPLGGGAPRTGRYVTVWQWGPDGRLRVALDAPDAPLPPASSGATRRPLRQLHSEDGRLAAVAGLLLEGEREVGGFLLVEVLDGDRWRVLLEVGDYRPDGP
jgi:ketosteroid isomerase-like protein